MIREIIKRKLPKTIKEKIIEFRNNNLDGYSTKSYSQEGEDIILGRLFERRKFGFYIDVGAHHPKRFSNTYYFYKKGWRGINIDAMPGSMIIFNKIRPRDINIEKPISDKKQILTYYAFNEPALNGFSKELSEKRNGIRSGKNVEYFIKFTKDIETTTLEDILDKYLPKNQSIDFLSIDVEGLDFEVLKSNNFAKYRPKIVLIEVLENSLDDIINNDITKFLNYLDYTIYAKTMNTVFFIDKYLRTCY